MLIIGLTGGIACGKSTVSQKIKNHGIPIIDADLIAKEVVKPGKPAYYKIINYFGPKVKDLIIESSGDYDKIKLGAYVFANKEELKVLNSIVHPAVKWEILKQIIIKYFQFYKMIVLDVPLLFEASMDMICGKTIVVVCDEEQQLERLRKRNPQLSFQDARNRINSQMSNHLRIRRADFIIDNSYSLDNLEDQIEGILKHVKPWFFIHLLEIFPPFGLISIFGVFLVKRIHLWNITHKKEKMK